MPRLDQRLKMVARQIRCRTHADIGSDHGYLLKALLKSGRIERGIAIENKHQPYENSKRTLAGLSADVRFFDGLAGLAAGEADCLSLCGMGGKTIVRLLAAHPERIPAIVLAQPNNHIDLVRTWGLQNGYDLTAESSAHGSPHSRLSRRFTILRFERSPDSRPDPAYTGLDLSSAIHFGPHFIRGWSDEFVNALQSDRAYLGQLSHLNPLATERLAAIDHLLSHPPTLPKL